MNLVKHYSRKLLMGVIIFTAALALIIQPTTARAGSNLGQALLSGFLGAIAIANAQKTWSQVPQTVQVCLVNQFHISPATLAQRGIAANDQRVIGYVRSCQQTVAAAEAQAAEQARLEQQREAAAEQAAAEQAAADERARREQAAEAEAAKKQAEAEAAAAEAARQARQRQLAAKFGTQVADAILANQVFRGMSRDAVLESKGPPDKKEVIPPSDELWYYGAERIAFSGGKVTYISN